jgi:hypothetical protein
MDRATSIPIVTIAILCGGTACTKTATPGGQIAADAWVNNGAHACERYLSHEDVAAILTNPEGASKALSVQACSYSTSDDAGSITITLLNAGPSAFDAYQKYLVDPQPLPGVGDKASQSLVGIDAVKGVDRSCTIDTVGAPGSLRLKGAELGQKLGAICNQLFALP